jgi:ATP-dependent exoDNAse (exonuclease V) alpha subunit
MTQATALEFLQSGRNVFLTGIAGAGKTYVLTQYIAYLKEKGKPFAITASTGIVATAIDGTTIHSFSGLGIKDTLNKNDLERLQFNKKIASRIKNIEVLIIDEISMLSANQLDCINAIFKYIRNSAGAFGGVQVVFCGDFLQLPPVNGEYAFKSMVWESMDLKVCYLDTPYRQKDASLLQILNAIRSNTVTDEIKAMVRKQEGAHIENFTVLFTHNEDVDAFNKRELDKLPGQSYFYKMSWWGNTHLVETIKRGCLSPEILEIRKGAKVMITRNNFEEGLVNGMLATVIDCYSDSVSVRTLQGKIVDIEREEWSMLNERGKPIASVKQVPLRLAYAITIHKSQGMTLDAAVMNLSRTFELGQGYVALSRLRALENLSIEEEVNDKAFLVNAEALAYEQEIMKQAQV